MQRLARTAARRRLAQARRKALRCREARARRLGQHAAGLLLALVALLRVTSDPDRPLPEDAATLWRDLAQLEQRSERIRERLNALVLTAAGRD
jgi:hypothetical protein